MAEWFLGASSSPLLYRRHVFEGFRVPQLAGAEDWPAKPACPPKPWRRRKLADADARLRPLGYGAAALLAEFTLGPRFARGAAKTGLPTEVARCDPQSTYALAGFRLCPPYRGRFGAPPSFLRN